MAQELITDELWAVVEPMVPTRRTRRHRLPGRKPADPRQVLSGIVFVLRTGCPWADVPAERFGVSGKTCWKYLDEWQQAGAWQAMHEAILDRLHRDGQIDWDAALVDSASVRAVFGGLTGPSPVDRRKPGSKHHLLCDGRGTPLACLVTGASRADITQLIPLVDAIPPVQGHRGRPKRKPRRLYADRAYDSCKHDLQLLARGITPVIARRRTDNGSGLGKVRWPVEQTMSLSTNSAACERATNDAATSTKH